MKKISKILLMSAMAVVLGTSAVFITSCGEAENNISISPSVNEAIDLKVGEQTTVSFKVENYINNGEVFVTSTDDSGYSSGSSSRAKITFEAEYKGSGVTEVVVEGVEGGIATLIAKTKEGGNKPASIKINVKEYSSTLELKETKIFVSPNTDLIPSDKLFNFSDNSTERDMNFYFVESGAVNEDTILLDQGYDAEGNKLFGDSDNNSLSIKTKQFVSCKLSDDKTKLIFTQEQIEGEKEPKTFEHAVYDTQANYFIAEYDNDTTTKILKAVKFNTFLGLDDESFEIRKEGKDEQVSAVDIVTYATEEKGKSEIVVKVPKSEDAQLCFEYDLSDEDMQKLSITLNEVVDKIKYTEYHYTIRSKVARRSSAKINFNLYYENFYGVDDDLVSMTKELNVEIYVKPNTIKVNGYLQSEPENNYTFYDNNVGDYGWEDFKISVYAEDSSYTDLTLEFGNDIDVRQGNSVISSGNKITDLSKAIQVRGKIAGEGEIILTLNSPFDKDASDKITYRIKYEVASGATTLAFTDERYNYTSTNQTNGVYVSTTGGEVEFEGIYADHSFKKVSLTSLVNSDVAKVEYVGSRTEKVQGNDRVYLILKITPLKVGNDVYEVRLDNGRSINVTIRVIKTLDNLFVNYEPNSNIYEFKTETDPNGDVVSSKIIIKNPSEENKFGQEATVKITSNNGIEVIKNLSLSNSNNSSNATIKETDKKGEYKITTNANGSASTVMFSVIGYAVDDFNVSEITKIHNLTIETYKLVSDFTVLNEQRLANSLVLYTGQGVTSDLSSKKLSYKVEGSQAYNFFSYVDDEYKTELFNEKFVYWTTNAEVKRGNQTINDKRMTYGNTYTIGNSLQLDTKSLTLSALPNALGGTFTLYAAVKQYGFTKAFAVNIEIKSFKEVKQVNTSLGGTEISFKKNDTEKKFIVNASPLDATLLDIDFVIEKKDGTKKSIITTPTKKEVKKGTWLVTLSLDPDIMVHEEDFNSECKLIISAKEWISNGVVNGDYQVKTFNITYQSGTKENPYRLETPEDVLKIGSSDSLMKSHYIISNIIDMSAYSGFPLSGNNGVFEGSIIGTTATAKITGIKITSGLTFEITNGSTTEKQIYFGLFSKIAEGAIIENVGFEGAIDISTPEVNDVYAGLIAGQNLGTLNNVGVTLAQSNAILNCENLYFGGVVGQNNGTIKKWETDSDKITTKANYVPILMEDQLTISVAEFIEKGYIGGIAGSNNGTIKDGSEKLLTSGHLGYLAYVDIDIKVVVPTGSSIKANSNINAGAVVGSSTVSLEGQLKDESKTIVGGRITANNSIVKIGGIVGNLPNEGQGVSYFKTRTFVEGYNVGAIVADVNYDPSNSNSNNLGVVTNIDVEEIDDSVSLNQKASMVVRYVTPSSGTTTTGFNKLSGNDNKLCYILMGREGITSLADNSLTAKTYSTRGFINDKKAGEKFGFNSQLGDYYGSYFEYDPNNNYFYGNFQFEKASEGLMKIECNDMSVELKTDDSSDPKVFLAYYFKAESYINEAGEYTTASLQTAQKLLDKYFNTISIDNPLRPFSITGTDITIKSESSLVSIDSQNNLIIRGTGVAKLKIYNTLNAREYQEVYLYIVNYFNNKNMDTDTFFLIDGSRCGSMATSSLVSDKNLIINIAPNYRTTASTLNINNSDSFKISTDGEVYIDNMAIQLAKNESVKPIIEIPDDSEFNKHASYDISNSLVTISKIDNVEIKKDTEDKIKLKASFSVEIEEKTYSYVYDKTCTLNLKYYEGTKAIKTYYDSYNINSGATQTDTFTIDSDDNSEKLHYTITGNGFEQTDSDEKGLFTVEKEQKDDELTGTLSIKVNKDSDEYKNRYSKNIFGEYNIHLTADSNENTAYKDITLTLNDQELDEVIFENYNDIKSRISSQKIVPAQYGMISVTLTPADVDFKTFVIENADSNYAVDSTSGIFQVCYMNGNELTTIDDVKYTQKGLSITKEKLIEEMKITKDNSEVENLYDGQFYIKYFFGYTKSLKDGTNIALNVKLLGENENEIYAQTLNYQINKDFTIYISVDGKELEDSKYYIAKGLEYGLTVENNGYDEDSVVVTSSNPSLASITYENGKYILKILSREIAQNERSLDITIKGSRIDADGNVVEKSTTITCYIMDYIFDLGEIVGDAEIYGHDIVKGYQNGVISVAISANNKLSIDLEKYLEFDSSNATVVNQVKKLMEDATLIGEWKAYIKSDEKAEVDWKSKEADPNINQVTIKNGNISNKYFEFKDLNFTVKIEHDPTANKMYMFSYTAYSHRKTDGTYEIVANSGKGYQNLASEFSIATYILGAEDTPNPITNYNNLKSMGANAHYILINDITITPETYQAINGIFSSLDGNGKTITFTGGSYTMTESELGVFSELSQDSVVKNLKVVYGSKANPVNIISTTSDASVFGGVVSRNSGAITNANVSGYINFTNSNASTGSYVAGLVGYNSGTITNSQVTVSIKLNGASLAGIAGTNSKLIASSYYKDGVLENLTEQNTNFNTAGLVNVNSESGTIITSYCSGVVGNNIYSVKTSGSELISNVQVSGAVHSNKGIIQDCYTNIPISTKSNSSGFVYENSGKIKNCFSTSILGSNKQTNYYFVALTSIEEQGSGSFENCYYLKDSDAEINQSLHPLIVKGVNDLDIEGFGNMSNFSSYSYGNGYNNVWMNVKTVQYPFNGMTLAQGRLELVSANIIASSERVEDGQTVIDGKTTYSYKYADSSPQPGTMLNPYIVNSAESFEKYMTIGRDSYFRIIKDINFNNEEITTYKTEFFGIIEGNGMTLSSLDITSGNSANSAGLLGSIKTATMPESYRPSYAGIMNLTIVPKIVNFPNVPIVGTLVGSVENATIENISVRSNLTENGGQDTSTVIVSGKNIVGGVVGLVKNKGYIKNVTSTVGSKATFIPTESSRLSITNGVYTGTNVNSVSYAGNVIGYAYASTDEINIKEIKVSSVSAYAIGDRAGFAFGGISKNVKAETITVNINESMLIKAYSFGGLIVGECAGNLKDVAVVGSGSQMQVFSVQPYISMGVGGVVGYMIRGSLSDVYMGQSFEIKNVSLTKTINYVGGIVGYLNSGDASSINFDRIVMDGDVSARNYLGGIIGYAKSNVIMNEMAVYKHNISVDGMLTEVYVGGFIGKNDSSVKITNSYSLASISASSFTYSTNIEMNVGAIIGKTEIGKVVDAQNVFTVTTYNLTIENKSENSDKVQVTNIEKEGEGSHGYNGLEIKVENEEKLFNLDNNDIKQQTVFNFVPVNKDSVLTSTTTLFVRANKDETNVKHFVNINEVGYGICSWNNSFLKTNDLGIAFVPEEKLYYSLGDYYNSLLSDYYNSLLKNSKVYDKYSYNSTLKTFTKTNSTTTLKAGQNLNIVSKVEEKVGEDTVTYYYVKVGSDYYKISSDEIEISTIWATEKDKDSIPIALPTLTFEQNLRKK